MPRTKSRKAETKVRPETLDIEEFKRLVVKVAKDLAAQHGWCDEVDRALEEELGLKGYMPARWVIEVREPRARTWKYYDEDEDYQEGDDLKEYCIDIAKGDYISKWRDLNNYYSRSRSYDYSVYVTPGQEDKAIAELIKAKETRAAETAREYKPVPATQLRGYRTALYRGKELIEVGYEVTIEDATPEDSELK